MFNTPGKARQEEFYGLFVECEEFEGIDPLARTLILSNCPYFY